MIHQHTELRFISEEIGYGVVATQFIPKGTITWVLDKLDREFTPKDLEKLESIYKDILHKYTFRNNKGNHVLCWDLSRYVNHSFNSNCLTTAYDYEIAIRDIHPGEELTDDYGYLNITEPFEAKPEGTERTKVYPDDVVRFHKEWDEKLQSAFLHLHQIPQPLSSVLDPENWHLANQISMGKVPMESILTVYFEDK